MNNIQIATNLKGLHTRLEKEKAERTLVVSQIRELQEKEREHGRNINKLQNQIRDIKGADLHMTEHAILRFIERVELLKPNEVEARVITENLKRMHSVLGNGTYPIDDTQFQCVIKNNTIITIHEAT